MVRRSHEERMISVIIPVRDEEEKLLRTLAALAPLAAQGFFADVVVADCGSLDATLRVADAAGCAIVENCGDRCSAIGQAILLARKGWLLGLLPGDIPDEALAIAARQHIAQTELAGTAPAAAFLALPAGAGVMRRAALASMFEKFGRAGPHIRRVLAPRGDAPLLAATGERWRGVRLKVRIERIANRANGE
jgi:glycosyltransferase involved in cell wall biosynthesis